MESSGVNVSSSDVPTEGWWFEQTHPSRKSSKRKAKPCPPPNHVDIANLASMLEEHGDSALPSIKLAVQGDPSVLNRMGLYEQVETSGQRSFTGTILHYAIVFKASRTVKWLVKQGAATNIKFVHRRRFIGHGTYHGLTPDLMALTTGDPQIYSIFFNNAVSLPQLVEIMQKRLSAFEKDKEELNEKISENQEAVKTEHKKYQRLCSNVQFLTSNLQSYQNRLQLLLSQVPTPEIQKEVTEVMALQSQVIFQLQQKTLNNDKAVGQ